MPHHGKKSSSTVTEERFNLTDLKLVSGPKQPAPAEAAAMMEAAATEEAAPVSDAAAPEEATEAEKRFRQQVHDDY